MEPLVPKTLVNILWRRAATSCLWNVSHLSQGSFFQGILPIPGFSCLEKSLEWIKLSPSGSCPTWAPITEVGGCHGRSGWRCPRKAGIFHGEVTPLSSSRSWQPTETFPCTPVNPAGSTLDLGAPGWLWTRCQSGNNGPREQSWSYHTAWEGWGSVAIFPTVGRAGLASQRLVKAPSPWACSAWISVPLSRCSWGILVYTATLAAEQFPIFFF